MFKLANPGKFLRGVITKAQHVLDSFLAPSCAQNQGLFLYLWQTLFYFGYIVFLADLVKYILDGSVCTNILMEEKYGGREVVKAFSGSSSLRKKALKQELR